MPTPQLAEGVSYWKVISVFFFRKKERPVPPAVLPSVRTDLKTLPPEKDCLIWFGHSPYYFQLAGRRYLVDPVMSGYASPFSFTTRSFPGTDPYTPEDLPLIDYLILTHDHYDHLDYKTLRKLRPKASAIITGLGVGSHLQRWGYEPGRIREMDWFESCAPEEKIKLHCLPARHFSGRGFRRNGTLWSSFSLEAGNRKIYIGGDSGYGPHFSDIGARYGPFDLAILENGQYNAYWKYIHMMPEEVVAAARDLKATTLFPVHWSKFNLSLHAWDEPIERVVNAAKEAVPLIHPMIGQPVDLWQHEVTTEWWHELSGKNKAGT